MPATHTTVAATGRRQPTWEVVEAIAVDALEAGRPIWSAATIEETQASLAAAGMARTVNVVGKLMELAGWHHEATDAERAIFRAHTPPLVTLFVMAGWGQADAAAFLEDRPKVSHAEVRAEVERRVGPPELNVVGHRLLHAISKWCTEASQLADRAEGEGGADLYSASVIELYQIMNGRRVDIEYRQLVDAERRKALQHHDPAAPLTEDDWRDLLTAGDLEDHG